MSEHLAEAQALKKEGNELFLKDKYAEAAAKYNDAVVRLPPLIDEDGESGEDAEAPESNEPQSVTLDEHLAHEETITLRTVLHCNLAACYLKLEQYDDAVKASTLGTCLLTSSA